MANQVIPDGFSYAGESDSDLSAKLHYFAKFTTGGNLDLAGDGGVVAGVITEAAASGYASTIQYGGIGKVIAAETITANARIASDTNGKAVAAAVGDFEVGTCIIGGDAGEHITFAFASGRRHA